MKITQKALLEIREHCRQTPRLESCGYFFGNGEVTEIRKGKNLDKSPVTYTIDSDSTFKSVFREDFMGVYHSHIGMPIPSSTDVNKKKYPDKYYIIYSVTKDALKAYFWDGRQFNDEPVVVV